mgnify:CR=1 FL=1
MSTSTPSTSHGAGTAATDSPAAIEAGIKANDDRAFEESLGAMSPFEVKNLLVKMAKKGDEGTTRTLLNAGRGNPNWITTLPREAFFLLGAFAMEEARRTMDEPDFDLAGMPAAEGAAARFLAFLDEHGREKPAQFLKRAWDYLDAEGLAGDELVHEWTGGIAGDEYPMPDRILRYTQEIVNRYLVKALDDGHAPATPYDLFATEGGTAAMCYLFYSLKCNFLVNPGDRIALMTPIFTPYLNIPTLNDYDLDVTYIQANTIDADGLHTWQYPDSELEKLHDPSIKLLCLVNPSNPPSVALDDASRAKLVSLVKNERPDLIIISDDVYGTFVPHYRSLLDDLPYNTACVYSFSKYFGATGWRRLAVIATAQNNVFDDLIAKLPDDKKRALANRYACLTDHIEKVKFTDRMVADSRLVALNGTAGLGTPQQVMMSLFALYCLLDDHDAYRTKMQQLVQHRLGLLWKSLGWTLEPDPERAGYYSVIDLSIWATRLYGADFFAWLKENYDSLDIVVRLAQDTGVVLSKDGHTLFVDLVAEDEERERLAERSGLADPHGDIPDKEYLEAAVIIHDNGHAHGECYATDRHTGMVRFGRFELTDMELNQLGRELPFLADREDPRKGQERPGRFFGGSPYVRHSERYVGGGRHEANPDIRAGIADYLDAALAEYRESGYSAYEGGMSMTGYQTRDLSDIKAFISYIASSPDCPATTTLRSWAEYEDLSDHAGFLTDLLDEARGRLDGFGLSGPECGAGVDADAMGVQGPAR